MRRRDFTRLTLSALGAGAGVLVAGSARAQMGAERPIGIRNDHERRVLSKLRCMCGGCARRPLSECECGYAGDRRDEIRAMMDRGVSDEDIQAAYIKRFGSESLEIPKNEGAARLLYIAPISAAVAGAVGLGFFLRRLRRASTTPTTKDGAPSAKRDAYDEKLDDELRRLDE